MASPSPNNNAHIPNKLPLTDEQKKMNHIASEQQRRQTIRSVFDQLSDIVPGMQGEARSEAKVLQATVEYMREQLAAKDELRARLMSAGMSEGDFEQMYREANLSVDGLNHAHQRSREPANGASLNGH